MADLVDLTKRREEDRLIWVCVCGCTVHRLYADGSVRCADCDFPAHGAPDNWRLRLPPAPETPVELDEKNFRVIELDSAETFLKRRLREPTDGIAAIVVVYEDGGLATYGAKTRTDAGASTWVREQLQIAADRLSPKA